MLYKFYQAPTTGSSRRNRPYYAETITVCIEIPTTNLGFTTMDSSKKCRNVISPQFSSKYNCKICLSIKIGSHFGKLWQKHLP